MTWKDAFMWNRLYEKWSQEGPKVNRETFPRITYFHDVGKFTIECNVVYNESNKQCLDETY